MKKILTLIAVCIVCTSLIDSTEINIWRKVSTDELNPGNIITLDMSKGYSFSDHQYIYIVVQPINSIEQVVVAFPNGGYWNAPEADPFLQELQKEFDSLEDYLRNLESKEIKKK
tara:strand:- start:207 stop:548 length:342 start_codon:yes stop_codon:yes gene_type:complete